MAEDRLCLAQNASNGAVTQLDGWDFSSFARVGHATFAANEDGLYQVDGNDFAGTAIVGYGELYIDLGQTMRCRSVWIGGEANGNLSLKVTVDDRTVNEYTVNFDPDQFGNLQHGKRVFLQPHQDKGQYLRLRFGNDETGRDFAVDLIDLVAIPLGHRRTGA